MKNGLLQIEKFLSVVCIFLIPTQLALHFWPAYSFVFGLRVDYLSPAIYLTDVLIISLIVLWIINDAGTFLSFVKKHIRIFLLLSLFILVNVAFSTNIWICLFKWIKILEIFLFGLYMYFRKDFVGEKVLIKSLFFSAIFFSLVGIVQFFLGRTTGLFYILGERTFNIATPGIALVSINGQSFLRAYSTFSHPNALAGFLGAVLILLIGSKGMKRTLWFYVGIIILALGIFLAFSLSAFLALTFIGLLFLKKMSKSFMSSTVKIIFWLSLLSSLFLPIFSGQVFAGISKNITERLDLSFISGKMISEKFLFGEGLNTFIVNIPRFNNGLMSTWLLQPVHNIFLLVFAETGVAGLLLFCWAIYVLLKNFVRRGKNVYLAVFIFILFTGLTDHYWLTIQQNLLFLSFLLGFSFADKKSG